MEVSPPIIQRHKTAIRRTGFSLPVQCVLRDGLLSPEQTLFDYGCGRGQDIELLRDRSIVCEGWDPVHRPQTPRTPADVVNLGYVLNVIEDKRERAEALRRAWDLSRQLLVVAAMTNVLASDKEYQCFADGVLTSRNTFQKYYAQAELRAYLEETTGADAIPAAPGVFYLFKAEEGKHQFLARRYQRRPMVPPQRLSVARFEQNQDVLAPFMERLTQLGRLPAEEELPEFEELTRRFGSLKRALALVKRVTEEEPWTQIALRRREDLLVYLALARFHRRPPFSKHPPQMQRDIKAFFGTYESACREADALLFQVADIGTIDAACQRAPAGQLVDNALLIHKSALESLDPLLRVYEGCARALLGEFEEADVIKLHRFSGKVSYLAYQDFETQLHPALQLRVKVSLRALDIDFFDYTNWSDPPVLESKESLLPIHGTV